MSYLLMGAGALLLFFGGKLLAERGRSAFSAAWGASAASLPALFPFLTRGQAEAVMSGTAGTAAVVMTLGMGISALIRPAEEDNGQMRSVSLTSLSAAASACGFLADGALAAGEACLLLLLSLASLWEGYLLRGKEKRGLKIRAGFALGILLSGIGLSLFTFFALDAALTAEATEKAAAYVVLPASLALSALSPGAWYAAKGRGRDGALTILFSAALSLALLLPLSALLGKAWKMTGALQVQFLPFLGIGATACAFPAAASGRTFRTQGGVLLFLAGAYGILTWIS